MNTTHAEAMTFGAPTFDRGLCADNAALADKGLAPDSWHPESYTHQRAQVRAAIKVCKACPVAEQCLAFAIENAEEHGIWGGTTPWQRHELIRATQAKRPCASEGCSSPRARRADDKGWLSVCSVHRTRPEGGVA